MANITAVSAGDTPNAGRVIWNANDSELESRIEAHATLATAHDTLYYTKAEIDTSLDNVHTAYDAAIAAAIPTVHPVTLQFHSAGSGYAYFGGKLTTQLMGAVVPFAGTISRITICDSYGEQNVYTPATTQSVAAGDKLTFYVNDPEVFLYKNGSESHAIAFANQSLRPLQAVYTIYII